MSAQSVASSSPSNSLPASCATSSTLPPPPRGLGERRPSGPHPGLHGSAAGRAASLGATSTPPRLGNFGNGVPRGHIQASTAQRLGERHPSRPRPRLHGSGTGGTGSLGATSRPLLIRAGAGRPLNDNRWHDVAIDIAASTAGDGGAEGDLRHTVHVDNTSRTDWLPRSTSSTVTTSGGHTHAHSTDCCTRTTKLSDARTADRQPYQDH